MMKSNFRKWHFLEGHADTLDAAIFIGLPRQRINRPDQTVGSWQTPARASCGFVTLTISIG
jgi:hypothetical protein